MKTYQATITKNRLEIYHDEDAESPREWDNLGYFYTKDSRNDSPDGKESPIYEIMIETGDEADNEKDHIKRMTKRINAETGEKVLAIFPVWKYEHSGVMYKRGNASGFDYSQNGFYIVLDNKETKGYTKKKIEAIIDGELDTFNTWLAGGVYAYNLYDKDGEEVDSCSGYYDLEAIKENLPEEWKNEELEKYII